ncbi:MAG: hypothetical protein ACYTGG_00025 [Planctomycetota bacterium]|jgi:hypothetical protein
MATLHQTISRARRRLLADHCLHGAGRGLTLAAALAIALLAADRLLAWNLPLLAFAGVLGAGAGLGMIATALRRPDPLDVAVRLDRALRLKDRIGTAVALQSAAPARPGQDFAPLVERDAEQYAGRLDVRGATPIRMTNIWGAGVVLVALLFLGFLFIPAVSRADERPPDGAPTAEQQAALLEQQQQIVESIDGVMDDLAGEAAADETTRRQLEALDRLARQLGDAAPDEAQVIESRDETAARLSELADHLADESERDAAAADEVARRFAGMSAPDAPMTTQQFMEALQRGDFGDAADVLEQWTEQFESMPAEQRREAAGELRELADRLQQAGDSGRADLDERAEQLRQALRDQGLDDEGIDRLLDEPSSTDDAPAPDVENLLRDEGSVDEEIARQVAEDIERLQRDRDIGRRAEQQVESITDELDQAADRVEQPPADEPASPQTPGPESTTPRTEQDQPDTPPAGEVTPGDPTPADPTKTPPAADQTTPPVADQSPPVAGEQPPSSESPTKPGDKPTSPPDAAPPAAPEKPTQEQPGQKPPDTDQPGDQQAPTKQPGQQQAPTKQPGQEAPTKQPGQQQAPTKQPGQEAPTKQPGQQQVPTKQPGQEAPTKQPGQQQAPMKQPGQQAIEKPGTPPDAASPQPMPKPGTDPAQMPSPQPPDGAAPEKPGDQPRPDGAEGPTRELPDAERLRSVAERLRKLAERRGPGDSRREMSDRLKQMARELADNMSEEEKREWAEQWQRQFGGERPAELPGLDEGPDRDPGPGTDTDRGPGTEPGRRLMSPPESPTSPPQTENLDLAGDETSDEVIAEWLSPLPGERVPGRTDRAAAAERLRRAQRIAERAVDDAAVPSRYHDLIKRYFDQVRRSHEKAPAKPDSPPPAAGAGDDS